jgi:hypothetical protein
MHAVRPYERGAKHKERNDEVTASLAIAIMTALSPGIVSLLSNTTRRISSYKHHRGLKERMMFLNGTGTLGQPVL